MSRMLCRPLLGTLSAQQIERPLVLKCVCVCVCVCVFIKLHITTQSGPVILVILTKNGTSRPEKPRKSVPPEDGVYERYKA